MAGPEDPAGAPPEILAGDRPGTGRPLGFAGWPIIQAWIAVPLAKLRGKFVLANIESSPWRASGVGPPWHQRCEAPWARSSPSPPCGWPISGSSHRAILQDLLPPGTPGAYVTPATWLNEEWFLGGRGGRRVLGRQAGPRPDVVHRAGCCRRRGSPCSFTRSGGDGSRDGRGVRDHRLRTTMRRGLRRGRAVARRHGRGDRPGEVPYGEPFLSCCGPSTRRWCPPSPTSSRGSPTTRCRRRSPSSAPRPGGSARSSSRGSAGGCRRRATPTPWPDRSSGPAGTGRNCGRWASGAGGRAGCDPSGDAP